MSQLTDLNRRKLLALSGATFGAAFVPDVALAQQKRAKNAAPAAVKEVAVAAGAGRKFFTASEFALLDEMAEAIIPEDPQSGGARAAKVAEFIDARIGESRDLEVRASWRDDLEEINRISFGISGKTFVASTLAERMRVLERISRNEANPKEAGEIAFGTIKLQVAFVYYKTKIGIHDELKYLGNTILDDFLGTDVVKL